MKLITKIVLSALVGLFVVCLFFFVKSIVINIGMRSAKRVTSIDSPYLKKGKFVEITYNCFFEGEYWLNEEEFDKYLCAKLYNRDQYIKVVHKDYSKNKLKGVEYFYGADTTEDYTYSEKHSLIGRVERMRPSYKKTAYTEVVVPEWAIDAVDPFTLETLNLDYQIVYYDEKVQREEFWKCLACILMCGTALVLFGAHAITERVTNNFFAEAEKKKKDMELKLIMFEADRMREWEEKRGKH